ncbi:hypothetical protein OAL67_00180 [bacterium]|nr:hypothetical protein [bacterium]
MLTIAITAFAVTRDNNATAAADAPKIEIVDEANVEELAAEEAPAVEKPAVEKPAEVEKAAAEEPAPAEVVEEADPPAEPVKLTLLTPEQVGGGNKVIENWGVPTKTMTIGAPMSASAERIELFYDVNTVTRVALVSSDPGRCTLLDETGQIVKDVSSGDVGFASAVELPPGYSLEISEVSFNSEVAYEDLEDGHYNTWVEVYILPEGMPVQQFVDARLPDWRDEQGKGLAFFLDHKGNMLDYSH